MLTSLKITDESESHCDALVSYGDTLVNEGVFAK